MFYFKKLWILLEIALLIIGIICKTLIPLTANSLIVALTENRSAILFDVTSWVSFLERMKKLAETTTPTIFGLFKVILLIIIAWLIVDIFNGQLIRDIRSANLTKFLTRNISQESLNVVMSEEQEANKWIKRARVIKWKKKLVFIMPILSNCTVTRIIQERCEGNLLEGLNSSFKNVNWTPLQIKKGGFVKWLIVRQK